MRNLSQKSFLSILLLSLSIQLSFAKASDSKNQSAQRQQVQSQIDQIEEKHEFPIGPEEAMTPGSLCEKASEFRYPEKIPYCNRNVDTSLKKKIFAEYDVKFGYKTQQIDRMKFKIDHLIPLCAGGSNNMDNLWPQHEVIYNLTDPLEPLLCDLMSKGKMLQEEVVELILEVKASPAMAIEVLQDLQKRQQN